MKLERSIEIFDSAHLAEVAVKAILADEEFLRRAKNACGMPGVSSRADPVESFKIAKKLAEEMMQQFGVKPDFS